MEKPLVSVIILCYNQEDFIAQAIESVLAQETDFRYEIILGDDASSDDTPRICQRYQAIYPDKIVLQLNEENKGICRNYFDCVQMAQGDFIADCAGDDFWIDPLKLQREMDAFRQHPQVSIVYSNWKTWLQNSQEFVLNNESYKEVIFKPKSYGSATVASFLSRRFLPNIVLSAATYRKEIVMAAYREHPDIFVGEGVVAEDLPVTSVLLKAGPAYYLPYEHLAYREMEESVSHSRNIHKKHRFIWACLKQTYQTAIALGIGKRSIRAFMKRSFRDELHYAYQYRQRDYAKEVFDYWRNTPYRMRLKDYVKYFLTRFYFNRKKSEK